jgi:hypothetical protein
MLASLDAVSISLEAVKERLVEAHAGVLLLSDLLGLLINRLSILNWGLLNGGGLLLLSWGVTVAAAAAHDASDGLMSNL